jgi:hypothetical protein
MTSFSIITSPNTNLNLNQWFKDATGKGKWSNTEKGDKSVEIKYDIGAIWFTFLEFSEPEDRLSRKRLGLNTHAVGLKNGNVKYVSHLVLTTKMIIGVVTDTDILEDDPRADLAYQLASAFKAIIFNGDYYVDHKGEIVLQ